MGENSKIQWTDHTFNPWIGCTKVHEGCANCYAERDMDHRYHKSKWGPSGTRVLTSADNWAQPFKWDREAAAAGERRRVFCASLADVFEDWEGPILDNKGRQLFWSHSRHPSESVWHWIPAQDCAGDELPVTLNDVRKRLFAVIDATPNLDWLLLTKRPQSIRGNMWAKMENTKQREIDEPYRHNVWLGTSISKQEHADKQIPELLKCRDLAKVLFLSIEPLLGPIDLGLSRATCNCCNRWPSRWVELPQTVTGDWPIGHESHCEPGIYRATSNPHGALSVPDQNGKLLGIKPSEFKSLGPIDWVIDGGESGRGAREYVLEYSLDLQGQCKVAGVPYFRKQLGAFPVATNANLFDFDFEQLEPWGDCAAGVSITLKDRKGADMAEWPEDMRVREFPTVELP